VFTGIVQGIGRVRSREARGGDLRLEFEVPEDVLAGLVTGDSIAVNGVCLTAVSIGGGTFAADVSSESLARTNLGALAAGARVNLESALRAGQPLSGHLMSGHVDATATILDVREDARALRIEVERPAALAAYVVEKGSVAIDGVSLTVNEVARDRFGVAIVPHTREHTIIGEYRAGARVNIEVDLIARYLRGLLAAGPDLDAV
jgi:riboflavin synthase